MTKSTPPFTFTQAIFFRVTRRWPFLLIGSLLLKSKGVLNTLILLTAFIQLLDAGCGLRGRAAGLSRLASPSSDCSSSWLRLASPVIRFGERGVELSLIVPAQ